VIGFKDRATKENTHSLVKQWRDKYHSKEPESLAPTEESLPTLKDVEAIYAQYKKPKTE